MTDDADVLSAADVLSFLGDQHRLDILETLYGERSEPGLDAPSATYSELQAATGIEDSGRFNYHLSRLTDHFVEKVDGAYRLRAPGKEIVLLLRRGTLTDPLEFDYRPTERTCFRCGAPVEVAYEGSLVLTRCTECPGYVVEDSVPEGLVTGTLFPPAGAADRDPSQLLDLAHDRFEHWIGMMAAGLCPECGGDVTASLTACPEHAGVPQNGSEPVRCETVRLASGVELAVSCRHCDRTRLAHPIQSAMGVPEVAAELRAAGAETAWERLGEASRWRYRIGDGGRVRFTSPSERASVTFEDATVVEATRDVG